MDPATLTLLAMLSAGAFACLAVLYVTIPYPAPNDVDQPLPALSGATASDISRPDAEGSRCDEYIRVAA